MNLPEMQRPVAAEGARTALDGVVVQFTPTNQEDAMHIVDAMNKIEETFWKLALIKQAVRGIAHRGISGDIANVDDETLPVEGLVGAIHAELEFIVNAVLDEARQARQSGGLSQEVSA